MRETLPFTLINENKQRNYAIKWNSLPYEYQQWVEMLSFICIQLNWINSNTISFMCNVNELLWMLSRLSMQREQLSRASERNQLKQRNACNARTARNRICNRCARVSVCVCVLCVAGVWANLINFDNKADTRLIYWTIPCRSSLSHCTQMRYDYELEQIRLRIV